MESSSEYDELIEVCGHAYRRIVLALLLDQERAFTMNDLMKAIAKHNHGLSLSEVSGEDLQRIGVPLHHTHIPRLEKPGLVEYNSDRHLVKPTDELATIAPHIFPLLDADPGLTRPAKL